MKSSISETLSTIILFLSPLFFQRLGHATLSSHWIVLACLWNYLEVENKNRLKIQTGINVMAALTNPYFCVISVVMTFAVIAREVMGESRLTIKYIFKFICYQIGIIIGIWAIMGYFAINQKNLIETGNNLGLFSANLNSFWNPIFDTSYLLNPVKTHHFEQYEGYGYLGFGVLFTLISIPVLLLNNKGLRSELGRHVVSPIFLPYIIACFLLFLYALSQKITFFDTVAIEFKDNYFIKNYLSIFRSSGRFVWVIGYSASIFALYCIHKTFHSNTKKIVAFSVVLFLQSIDMHSPLLANYKVQDHQNKHVSSLKNEVWDYVYQNCKNIITYPTHQRRTHNDEDYIEFLYKALPLRNNVSTGYLARFDNKLIKSFNEEVYEKIKTGTIDSNEAIVTSESNILLIDEALQKSLNTIAFKLDGYVVLINSKNKLANYLNLKSESFKKKAVFKHISEKYYDNIILISGKDECTASLAKEDKEFMKQIGGNLEKIAYRGSYCAVLYHGKIVQENLSDLNQARILLTPETIFEDFKLGKYIDLISEGKIVKAEGEISAINVDGKDFSLNRRGMNIVILDKSLNVVNISNYDTHMMGYTVNIPDFTENVVK
jgi:hypothetical protein